MKRNRIKTAAVLLAAAVLCSQLGGCSNSIDKSSGTESGSQTVSADAQDNIQTSVIDSLVIAEVMSKNKETLLDENQAAPDYISLYNGGETMSLKGCFLSDDKDEQKMWELPDVTLEKGGYYTVLCDSLNTAGTVYPHASFSISSSGETIYLTLSDGTATSLYVPAMPADIAYGLVMDGDGAGTYHYFKSGSPGTRNTSEHSAELSDIYSAEVPPIVLNEYMLSNQSKATDNYGNSSDWIELYNSGATEADISGMAISDSLSKPGKWIFPDGVKIPAGGYLIVWCDGLDEYKGGNLHTSFKLSENDDGIVMTDKNGLTVFAVPMKYPEKDTSCGLNENGEYVFFAEPTPAAANTTPSSATPTAKFRQSTSAYISETAACSSKGIDSDWIELGNMSAGAVSLKGWGIGKVPTAPEYTFSDVSLTAGEFILLYADGGKSGEGIHLPFKISQNGDRLYLFDNDGYCCDTIEFDRLMPGNTCGKSSDGQTVYYSEPSPKTENPSKSYLGYAPSPSLSNAGGYAENGEKLTCASQDISLKYTTDGTDPTADSPTFSGTTISSSCVLKFRAYKDGYLPSPVYSATYIVGQKHEIPIVCLSCDPDDLFSDEKGIFAYGKSYSSDFPYEGANFWKDWERKASFEYYTADGTRQIGCDAGIKVFGQFSRAYDQKSVAVHFRGSYGTSSVKYPFFEGNSVTEFSSLVLRAGGQDQKYTRIRDAFCSEVFSSYSNIAYMDWQPTAVYINGEYYGFYDLREKINESYFESHENIDRENLDLLKGNGRIVLSGDSKDYYDMVDYIASHDMSDPKNYDYICSKMDVDNYIDYLISEIFFCNGDTGNIKFYRDSVSGKWKWVMFDFDMALRSEATWSSDYNSIKLLFNPDGHGANNSFFTTVQCGLIKNPQFRQKFIERYAELLNTAFQPSVLNAKIDEMTALIDSEMKLHGERWERPTYTSWQSSVKVLKDICSKRHDIAKQQLISFMNISESEQAKLFKQA